jgi:hypothetical protein
MGTWFGRGGDGGRCPAGRSAGGRIALALGAVGLLAALGACGTSSANGPSAATLLAQAQAKFNQTRTFHFTLTASHLGPNDPLAVSAAQGDVQRPDELSATATVITSGLTLDAKLVIIGQQEWFTTSITGTQKTTQFASFLAIFDPQQGVGGILTRVQNPSAPQDATVGGRSCWKISGRAQTSDLAAIVGGTVLPNKTVPASVCIGKADNELYSVTLSGPVTQTDTPQTSRSFTLSNFDQPVSIQPPA